MESIKFANLAARFLLELCALAALGYSDQEIDSALNRVAPGADVEETLRQALAFLSGF